MVPFPFRSRTSHASSEPSAVHDVCCGVPVFLKLNITPRAASVMLKPSPLRSTRIGVLIHSPSAQVQPSLQSLLYSHSTHFRGTELPHHRLQHRRSSVQLCPI